MNRVRLLFLVALVAIAAFALVPAMAQGEEAGPVGRWNLRVGGQMGRPYLFDTVTGRVWRLEANVWSEIKRPPS
jgi:hypothetical protein